MSRKVKCLYCEEYFSRDNEDYVQVGKRYAHKKCSEEYISQKSQEEKDKETLESYIVQLFGQLLPFHRKQIKVLIENGYTYSAIYKTLYYFYGIKGNSTEKSKGIGIVPYVVLDARDYFTKKAQLESQANTIESNGTKDVVVRIVSPKAKTRKKLIDLDLLEGENANE